MREVAGNPAYDRVIDVFCAARSCTKCYGNVPLCVPLPDENNGAIRAEVMFVCERPGRIGTGRTCRISFENPDPSAEAFRSLLASAGLPRERIFITNAVLCYPRTEEYRDTPPSAAQIRNCSPFLQKQIDLLRPRLLVPCGNAARKALCLLYHASEALGRFRLKVDVGHAIRDTVPWIYPVYHTSRRVQIRWRPLAAQRQDWAKLPQLLHELDESRGSAVT